MEPRLISTGVSGDCSKYRSLASPERAVTPRSISTGVSGDCLSLRTECSVLACIGPESRYPIVAIGQGTAYGGITLDGGQQRGPPCAAFTEAARDCLL